MSRTPDQDCFTLTYALQSERPFFFVRIGDGAIELLDHRQGHTCDQEHYSPTLALHVQAAINMLKAGGKRVLFGDWRTAVAGSEPRYLEQWCKLIEPEGRILLNYESLLLMRESPELVEFYRTARNDPRYKVFVGPARNAGAAAMLKADHLVTPENNLLEYLEELQERLITRRPQVIYFGAGMAGLVAVVDYWWLNQKTTCVHLGSAMDPLFSRRSRSNQLPMATLRAMFKDLL